jgi:hypothetical protein
MGFIIVEFKLQAVDYKSSKSYSGNSVVLYYRHIHQTKGAGYEIQ